MEDNDNINQNANPAADQLEVIRMKQELQELGAIGTLNQRVINYH